MKYLKGTLFLFVVTLCLSMAGVSARQYTQLINIKIPIWEGEFVSKQVDKGDDWSMTQKVKKQQFLMIYQEMAELLRVKFKECFMA